MPLTLTALDAAHEEPDASTIARVLATLDGGRVSIATLGRSESEYVQVRGSVATGLTVEYQDGTAARRYRSQNQRLGLDAALPVFLKYAQGDPAWRDALAWVEEREEAAPTGLTSTWAGFFVLIAVAAALIWLWRGW